MSLSKSTFQQDKNVFDLPLKSINNQKSSQQCRQCGLKFQSIRQVLNHQKRFCQKSGYDNLTGLLMKQTNKNQHKLDYKLGRQKQFSNKKQNQNKMKNYGQYSLSKINYEPQNDQIINRNPLLLYDDMLEIQKHKKNLEFQRPYQLKSRNFENSQKKDSISKFNSEKKEQHVKFQNSRSSSAFSYKLNDLNFGQKRQSQVDYLQSLLLKNQQQTGLSAKQNLMKRSINQFNGLNSSHLIKYKDNPASQKFENEAIKNQYSILNKSDASIANMSIQKKITYAKFKLDQLRGIQQLYFKNGGQSKQLKKNIQNMIQFYEKLLLECKNNDKQQVQTQLSIESRPETPILKLNDLNTKYKNHQKQKFKTIDQVSPRARIHRNQPQQRINQKLPYSIKNNPNSLTFPLQNGLDPNFYIAQNYANLYQMKLMEDILKSKSDQNRKLIEALINTKNQSQENQKIKKNNNNKPNFLQSKATQIQNQLNQDYRFSKSLNTGNTSQDRILKLLQEQELDELKLISQLPINLQQQKVQSVVKNAQLRFKMQKQILRQKVQRLSWQQKLQNFQEHRQMKNNDWVGSNNKEVIQTQIKQYLHDFQSEFKPQ